MGCVPREFVLVHGWAMHSGLWGDQNEPFLGGLLALGNVTLVDLPGHGMSPEPQAFGEGLDDWAQALLQVAPQRATWIGWSLGGMVAQRVAVLAPERVAHLVLLSSSPCFTQRADWPLAVDSRVLRQFADNLRAAPEKTLIRFLSLQIKDSDDAKRTLRQLRQRLSTRPMARASVLDLGLDFLLHQDLRDSWRDMACSGTLILGEQDSLVPEGMGQEARKLLNSKWTVPVLNGSGHAPFLSAPNAVLRLIQIALEQQ